MRKKLALLFNILIVIGELLGLLITIFNSKLEFKYYTIDSNILALISSLLFVIYIIKGKKIPNIISVLKYVSTLCLTITFLVVILVLAPSYNNGYVYLLFTGSMFFYHTFCPLLSIISFIFFENHDIKGKKYNFVPLFFTLIYGLIIVYLNILKVIEGPYPFLKFYKTPLNKVIITNIFILVLTYVLSYILLGLKRKFNYDEK